MSMTEREAAALVDLLTRAYPTYPLDSGGAALYVNALQTGRHSAAVVASAIAKWIKNESWMPKVNELLDAITVEAAGRRLDDANARNVGALPVGQFKPVPRSAGAMSASIMRQVRKLMPPPSHDHHAGAEHCAACVSKDEYAERFAERCAQLAAEHPELVDDESPVESFVCARCLDVGFVEEDAGDERTVLIPCPCNPDRYDRWREGHYAPGHRCAECDALVRGKRNA